MDTLLGLASFLISSLPFQREFNLGGGIIISFKSEVIFEMASLYQSCTGTAFHLFSFHIFLKKKETGAKLPLIISAFINC